MKNEINMFNPDKTITPVQEKERTEYFFPEIEIFEKPMREVVLQMKQEIEAGVYKVLLGDDIGGRIPTLILNEIIKEKNPQKDLGMFFVAGGHELPGRGNFVDGYDDFYFDGSFYERSEDEEEQRRYQMSNPLEKEKINLLKKYLAQNIDQFQHGRVLICSEYAHFGKTLFALGKYLEQIDADPFDMMCLGILNKEELRAKFPFSKVFSAGVSSPEGDMGQATERIRKVLAIKKRSSNDKYLPYVEDIVEQNEEQRKEMEIQKGKLIEDIKLLSQRIISEVWL